MGRNNAIKGEGVGYPLFVVVTAKNREKSIDSPLLSY
jgi:hypothetical protein